MLRTARLSGFEPGDVHQIGQRGESHLRRSSRQLGYPLLFRQYAHRISRHSAYVPTTSPCSPTPAGRYVPDRDGTPAWLPNNAIAVQRAPQGTAHLSRLPVPFHVREGTAYVGLEDRLFILKPSGNVEVVDLPGKILSLYSSPPWSRARVAAALEQGAVPYWDDYQGRSTSLAVLRTSRPDQFALVGADGVVAIYQVPRWPD